MLSYLENSLPKFPTPSASKIAKEVLSLLIHFTNASFSKVSPNDVRKIAFQKLISYCLGQAMKILFDPKV